MRRAGIVPILFLGIVVSQWLVNSIETPLDRKSMMLGFMVAWLIPPIVTLVWQLIAAPAAPATEPTAIAAPPTTRSTSSRSALTAVAASAIVGLAIWIVLAATGAPPAWIT